MGAWYVATILFFLFIFLFQVLVAYNNIDRITQAVLLNTLSGRWTRSNPEPFDYKRINY